MDRTYGHLADCVLQSTPKLSDEHSSTNDSLPPDGLHTNANPKPSYGNVDLNGSKVIRLVRAKQATKRKSSLDTLIEVVQKELLRVNGQSTCPSPSSSPPPTSTSTLTPTILSSSCSSSSSSSSQRPKRIPSPLNTQPESNETIEEIVRDTVDKLVAITLLNNAPFFVNMLTTPPDSSKGLTNGNTSTTRSSSSSSHPPATSDLALLSSAASDIRNSMQQTSPSKTPVTPTVLMTPRLVNLQTVLPKPTTNIQIGNTKIILVSPPTSSVPVKLVKFTPSTTTTTTTTTMPKNVQIVLPSSTTDPIPAASQEVTITSSPPLTIGKPRRRSSTSTPIDKPVGKILRPIAKVLPVYSPSNPEEILPPINKINLTTATPTTVQRTSTNHGPMIYRMTSVNPNVPVFRVRTSTSTTETKPLINGTTTNGSVSVLACFKTTKKRNKERAIMPRPTSEPVEPPSNIRLIPSTPITTTSPTRLKISRPIMEDKGIQCINNDHGPMNSHLADETSTIKKRELNEFDDDDDSWTVAADTLLRNVLSQYCFRFLDMNCQQNLSSRFDTIQANLVSGMIPTHDQFYQSVMEIKEHLLSNEVSKMSIDNVEKLFHYFQIEYPKLCQGKSLSRTNERKRTRRQ